MSVLLPAPFSPTRAWAPPRRRGRAPPSPPQRPLVGAVEAVHDLHERALACTVLPYQGVDLAKTQVEAHPFHGDHAPEALGDVLETEDGSRFGRRGSSSAGLVGLRQVLAPSLSSRGTVSITPRGFSKAS